MSNKDEATPTWAEIQAALAEPMEFKVKPGTNPKLGRDGKTFYALALGYISREQVQDRLDEGLGPGNWQFDWEPLSDVSKMVKGTIKFRLPGTSEWISVSEIGGPDVAGPGSSDTNLWKTGVSDSFKRAATMLPGGVGRFLYSLPQKYPACEAYDTGKKDKYGKPIYGFKRWIGDPVAALMGKAKPRPAPRPPVPESTSVTESPENDLAAPYKGQGSLEDLGAATEPENAPESKPSPESYHTVIKSWYKGMTDKYPAHAQEISQWLVSQAVNAGGAQIPDVKDVEALEGIIAQMELYEAQLKKRGARA